jgi:hypothetical protein
MRVVKVTHQLHTRRMLDRRLHRQAGNTAL